MNALALAQVALAILPLVQTGVTEFVNWINALRSAAKQAGEWTDAQEKLYRASLYAKLGDLAYGPDPNTP
jgi:hypothetical protein